MTEIDFYFDVVCPYAYLASTEIEDLAARTGAKLNLRPILLGGIYRAIGQADVPSNQKAEAKLRVEGIDLLRWAEHRGVPLNFPAGHPRRTVEAMRLFHATPESAWPALMHALYRAYWVEGRDVRDRAVLAEIAGSLRLDGELARSGIDAQPVKDALRRATDEAVAAGAFGVPTMVVRSGETRSLYWGQDRLDLLEAQLGGRSTAKSALSPTAAGEVVDFYYDFSSPYAYLGATQIERVVAGRGAQVRWKPMLLGALFKKIGTADVPMLAHPEPKRRWLGKDLDDWARHWHVPFRWPTRFPMRTVSALRLVLAVEEKLRPALSLALFAAYWAEDRDLADPGVLGDVLAKVGGDPEALRRVEAGDDLLKQALIKSTDEAFAAGVCGAPSMVARGHLLWGQDRLGHLDRILAGWKPTAG